MKIFSFFIISTLADEADNCLQKRLNQYCQTLTVDGEDRCLYADRTLRYTFTFLNPTAAGCGKFVNMS